MKACVNGIARSSKMPLMIFVYVQQFYIIVVIVYLYKKKMYVGMRVYNMMCTHLQVYVVHLLNTYLYQYYFGKIEGEIH